MAEIRLSMGGNTDWRSAVKKRQSGEVQETNEPKRKAIREFDFNESVTVEGIEYWFEPDRAPCMQALGLSREQVGSFGVKKSVVNFYDYHQSVGSADAKGRFLEVLKTVSTETTLDGYQTIHWKNCCAKSFDDVRRGLYDYLETYVWPQKCSEIVSLIDSYVRTTNVSQQEMFMKDIIIGEKFFNDLFYLTSLAVAEAVLTPELINSMLESVPDKISAFTSHSMPHNVLITQLDEAQRHVFRTCLRDGQFERESFLRPIRYWRCSPNDLRTRILPLILFISNWSLVLGAYLTVAEFGALAFTIGE